MSHGSGRTAGGVRSRVAVGFRAAALLLALVGLEKPVSAAGMGIAGTSPALDTLPPGPEECWVRFIPVHALEIARFRTDAVLAGAGDVGYRTRVRPGVTCEPLLEARAGAAGETGRLGLVAGRPPESGSVPLKDRGGVAGRLRWEVGLPSLLGRTPDPDLLSRIRLGGEWRIAGPRGRVEALYGEALLGGMYVWMGRRAPAYGPGRSGGIVLSGRVPLDGIGTGTATPVRLPWLLARVGEVDFEAVLARGADNGDVGHPFILAGRGTLAFSRNVVFGVNRGIMFGGDGVPNLTLRRILWMLIGDHQYEDGKWIQMDNQIASFDLAWRALPGGKPVLLFLEWGLEDSAGAWARSPGIVAGVEAVDPDRGLRLGLEHTRLFREDHHGIWYRHGTYRAGWSDKGRLLGHPLGGPGTEWLLHGASHATDGSWDVQAGLHSRHRFSQNSFAPYREGRALGGFLEGRMRISLLQERPGDRLLQERPGARFFDDLLTPGLLDLYVQLDGERLTGGGWVGRAEGGVRWTPGRECSRVPSSSGLETRPPQPA
jgi:hypothetical protein